MDIMFYRNPFLCVQKYEEKQKKIPNHLHYIIDRILSAIRIFRNQSSKSFFIIPSKENVNNTIQSIQHNLLYKEH